MDTDFHQYKRDDGTKSISVKPITIGNNCWIGARSIILKGSFVANGCIVAANSTIAGCYNEERCIIGGNLGVVSRRGCEKIIQ